MKRLARLIDENAIDRATYGYRKEILQSQKLFKY